MSVRLKYFAGNPGFFAPGTPVGRIPTFPFDYMTAEGVTPGGQYPFSMSFAQAHKLWWVPKTLEMDIAVTYGSEVAEITVALPRIMDVPFVEPDERMLQYPGILIGDELNSPEAGCFRYVGSHELHDTINPDSLIQANFDVRMFGKTNRDGFADIQHMKWNEAGTIILPSITIDGSMLIETPFDETNGSIKSYLDLFGVDAGVDYNEAEGDFLTFDGGGAMPLFVPPSFESTTWTVRVTEWFSHGGRWDTATGAFLG